MINRNQAQVSRGSLVVVLPILPEEHRLRIRQAGEARGFSVLFFETEAESLPFLKDAEIILGQSSVLAQNAPGLRWFCTPSAGVDHLIKPGILPPTAALTNSSGAYGVTISEHTVMMLLALFRQRLAYDGIVARHEWKRDLPVRSIRGSRILLLGTGDIGQETARRLRAFEPASLIGINRSGVNPNHLFDRVISLPEWETLLPEADALILSLPDTAETRRLLDAPRLALLPDGAVILNVGRGSAIDQEALERELRKGRLQAALDVFESEPLPPDDPLWTCPNLLISPHCAGNMTLPWTVRRIVDLFLENFENYCEEKPLLRRIDPKKGY